MIKINIHQIHYSNSVTKNIYIGDNVYTYAETTIIRQFTNRSAIW